MIKIQSVLVDDGDAVRLAIEKQEVRPMKFNTPIRVHTHILYSHITYIFRSQKVLRELKMKKPQLNELVHTAEVLKGDVKRQQLQEKGESFKNYGGFECIEFGMAFSRG